MCGFFIVLNLKNHSDNKQIDYDFAKKCSGQIAYRGPDQTNEYISDNGSFFSHHRLSIIDLSNRGSQPHLSKNKQNIICFNGEIYNYKELRSGLLIEDISGDTELISEVFSRKSDPLDLLEKFDGMFAFCSYDLSSKNYYLVRDPVGIKPLYYRFFQDQLIASSEAYPIAMWCHEKIDPISEEEIRIFRRPTPGFSFFEGVKELLPGNFLTGTYNSKPKRWKNSFFKNSYNNFSYQKIKKIIKNSIELNTVSDVPISGFQSGGIDSTIVTKYAKPSHLYSVGFKHDNEFFTAKKVADLSQIKITCLEIIANSYNELALEYINKKKEPISVPNEVLIYALCKKLGDKRKVFLTGEGADEIFFGYDKIFRWAYKYGEISSEKIFINIFLEKYAYINSKNIPQRFLEYISNILKDNNLALDFIEDFFLNFHLPGLLMRVDKSSMAAGKEARVPFCSKLLIDFMYRQPYKRRISKNYSKIPLRKILKDSEYSFVNQIPKIGFRTLLPNMNKKDMYIYINDLYYKNKNL